LVTIQASRSSVVNCATSLGRTDYTSSTGLIVSIVASKARILSGDCAGTIKVVVETKWLSCAKSTVPSSRIVPVGTIGAS
jgi:hypothetical protein